MRTFRCACGNRVFFDNTACVACDRMLGWCPDCNALRGLDPTPQGDWRCSRASCGARLLPCENYQRYQVCNRMIHAGTNERLCRACAHNRTVPDTGIAGNREKWARLEAAKRRLLYLLDLLGLPYDHSSESDSPVLSFDFKAELILSHDDWQDAAVIEPVYTGHAQGHITINLDEADDVEREKRRVEMNELHRTLVGHFRHEIAHYYWERLVRGSHEAAFVRVFGNHREPDYQTALAHYYNQGPPDDWRRRYVSAYAAMHPWEDFAETFGAYLDMVAVLDTAAHWQWTTAQPPDADLDTMIDEYSRLGVVLNEINRENGLLDLVPEVMVPPVIDKLRFIDDLVRANAHHDNRNVREAGA